MKSTITVRGQTVVPVEIRRQFHLGPSDRLEWLVDSTGIRVVPVRDDPILAFRGSGKGGSSERLLRDRQDDPARG